MRTLFILSLLYFCAPVFAGWSDKEEAVWNYGNRCSVCHGENGRGDGDYARSFPRHPANFTDCKVMALKTDESLFEFIKNGGGLVHLMPPFKYSFDDKEVNNLVAYIRGFCKP